MRFLSSWVVILLVTQCVSGCAYYRVVPLGSGVDEEGKINSFYAVARNNVVIPEYVIDEFGHYPVTTDEARSRFKSNKHEVESWMREKYDLPADFPRQFSRYFFGFCFALVSPVAIPVQWLGEIFSRQTENRPISKIAADYFNASFYPPVYEKPKIRERTDYMF